MGAGPRSRVRASVLGQKEVCLRDWGGPCVTFLQNMVASSSLLQRGLQVFAVLQWVFSLLGLHESPRPGDLGRAPAAGGLVFLYPEGGGVGRESGEQVGWKGAEGRLRFTHLYCELPLPRLPAQVRPAAWLPAFLGRAWMLVVLYLAWLYWDRNTPRAGGQRSAWVRNWAVWRHSRDYFPLLVRTSGSGVLGAVGASE